MQSYRTHLAHVIGALTQSSCLHQQSNPGVISAFIEQLLRLTWRLPFVTSLFRS